MAQDTRPSQSAKQGQATSDRKTTKNDGSDGDRAPIADLGANSGADFQVSLSTATSIAGLTAYAAPYASSASYVSDEEIAADMAQPLSYQPSDRALNLAANTEASGDAETAFQSPEIASESDADAVSKTPGTAASSQVSSRNSETSEVAPDQDRLGSQVDAVSGAQASDNSNATDDTGNEASVSSVEVWTPESDLSATFAEDTSGGAEVMVLAANDQYGDPITYQITDSSGSPITDSGFEIDGNRIVVASGGSFDFESESDLTLYITSTNSGGTSGPWSVALTVTDVAEDIALSDGGDAFVDTGVAETSITGGDGADTITGHNDGADISGGAGTDEITGGAGADVLAGDAGDDTLDGSAGTDTAIFTGAWSDYSITESGGVFTVVDNRPGSPDGTDTLTNIEVFRFSDGDVSPADALNDGPTVTASDGAVSENDAGAIVGAVSASDPDAGDTVSLAVDDARFEIVGGQLKLKDGESLDFETDGASVNVTVTATDTHGATDIQVVTVTVGDVNEGPSLTAGSGTVDENDSGAAILNVGGSDPDAGDSLTYSVDDTRFEVVGGELRLRTGVSLDHETEDSVVVQVTATDQGGLSTTESYTITVDNVNEGPTVSASDGTVTENDAGAIVGAVSGTDPDAGDSLTYSVDDTRFEVVGGQLKLKDGVSLDYEGETSVSVTVAVTDGSGATDTQVVTVTVGDEAEAITLNDGGATFTDAGVAETLITGGDGADTITGHADGANLDGAAGDDSLVGGASGDNLAGGSGADTLIGDDGADTLAGGLGADTLSGDAGDDSLSGDEGADSLAGGAGHDTLDGGDGDDTLDAATGDDLLTGGAGDDALAGGAGNDTATWDGELDDFGVTYDAGSETFTITDLAPGDGDEGADTVTGVETFTFGGTEYSVADLIAVADEQANNAPTDVMFASGGSVGETVGDGGTIGSAFDPSGSTVATLATTDDAGDTHSYSIVNDPSGHFEIVGDEVRVRTGQTIDYESATSFDVTIRATDQYGATVDRTLTVNVTDFEGAHTAGGAGEAVTGTSEEDVITGGAGADTLTGGSGDDTLSGGDGSDEFQVADADGSDAISGGTGDDTLTLASGGSNGVDVAFSGDGAGTYDFVGTDGDGAFDGIEAVSGTSSDDTLDGAAASTDLSLDGGAGDDLVTGGAGDDSLVGDAGDDTLQGASGDDTLSGGDGTDLAIYDGDLSDFSIIYDSGSETFTITDLNAGDGDEGQDVVTGVENFRFNGTDYTASDLILVADEQANTGPGSPSVTAGGAVDENSATGTVVATLTAADPDGDTLTYQITDASGNPVSDSNFEIVGNEIRVRAGADLDFEAATSHGLYVTASDDYVTSSPTAITVTVNDVAEAIQLGDGGETFADTSVTETSVTGGAGGDTIVGTSGGDDLDGGAGNDVLSSGAGDDTIRGGSGDDSIVSGTGDDSVLGGDGDDIINGADGADTLGGEAGADTIQGGAGDDVIDGGADGDTAIYAGDFDDFAITYDTGTGTFTITDTNTGDGDEGSDTVTNVETFQFNGVTYSAADLIFEADRQANTGPDSPSVSSGGDIDENSAAGTVVATLTAADPDGDALTYQITDASGNPVTDSNFEIVGDEIRVRSGADLDHETATSFDLYLTASDTHETSAPQAVTVTVNDVAEDIVLDTGGAAFTDTGVAETSITGNTGDDTIQAHSAGSDIDGAAGDDSLTGGAGDDSLTGGAGDDTIDGGTGTDTAEWAGDFSDFAISYNAGTETFTITDLNAGDGDEGRDTVTDIETFVFNGVTYTEADLITEAERQANTGPGSPSVATGGSVLENSAAGTVVATLSAVDADGDTLTYAFTDAGGTPIANSNFEIVGNEIRVRTGADLDYETATTHGVYITASDDFETSAPQAVVLTVGDVAEAITLGDGGATFTDAGVAETSITGGTGGDTITGHGDGANIDGAAGADQIAGGAGDDTLAGGDGADTVTGDQGDDTIDGGTGDDQITGGAGDDNIDGGTGTDTATWDGDLADFVVTYDTGSQTFTITDQNTTDGDEGSDSVTNVETFVFNGITYSAADMIFEADRQANTGPDSPTVASGGAIDENSAAGTIVATLTATDTDGDALTYQITDASGNPVTNSNFEIVGDEIRVRSGADLNYESATSHGLYITASDDHETSAPQWVTVTVNDVAEDIQLGDGGHSFTDTGVAESSITGGAGSDTITAHDGGGAIDGGAGDDSIRGGAGDDTLEGGDGDDTIDGGAGDDTIYFGDGANTVSGGDGNDFIDDEAGNPSTTGGDYVDAGAGDDTVFSGDSDDTVDGGDGNDIINAQTGNDDVQGGSGSDRLYGDAGNDTLSGGSDDDSLEGGAGDDSLSGDAGDDLLTGGGGDDTIDGGTGTDTAVFTGAWSDYIITETGGTYTITDTRPGSPDGTDTLINVETLRFSDGDVSPADALNDGPSVSATDGAITENDAGAVVGAVSATDPDAGDTVTLSVDDARFEIVDGDLKLKDGVSLDYEDGATVSVTVTATDSHGETDSQVVTVTVGDQAEAITLGNGGEAFTDTGVAETSITGGAGADTITAHDDGSTIDGGTGSDSLSGGSGDDTLKGGTGDDTLAAGAGTDEAVWDGNFSDFSIAYDAGSQTFTITDNLYTMDGGPDPDEGTDTVTGVESFTFNGVTYTAAQLIEEAEAQANTAPTDITFTGGNVGETVADGGTIATAYDPSGATVATLSAVDAQGGDSHSYTLTSDPSGHFEIVGNEVRVRSGQVIDYETDSSFDITVQVTDQHGATYDEVITINVTDFEGSHTAGAGGETIVGTSEEDLITGGAGNDNIQGGTGDDTVDGGAGSDTLTGGAGDDSLSGGDGSDRFVLEDGFGSDTLVGGEDSGDWDTLDLSGLSNGATVTLTGDEAGTITDGSDTASFSEIEEIRGTDGNDYIDGSAAASGMDYVVSGAGDDTLIGTSGQDDLRGGDGDDSIVGGEGGGNLEGGAGNDTVTGGSGSEDIYGNSGDDSLSGEGGDDWISAGSGADTISGGAGDDYIEVQGDSDTDTVVLEDGGGNDTIYGFDGPVDTGGGVYTSEDVLDVSGLTNAYGNPVNAGDVTVTDTNGDGTGDAVLTFPGGESVTLEGVLASEVSSEDQLAAIGIPAAHTHEGLSQLIFLGNFAELDTDESTNGYEGSTAPIIGSTLSGTGANANVVSFSYNDADGDGNFEGNHKGAGENLTVNGVSSPIDEIVLVTVRMTFDDGSTSNVAIIGYQLENGDFYLGDFQDRIEGQSVTSLEVIGITDTFDVGSLSQFQGGGYYDLDNFTFVDAPDHVVEGTSGDDVIDTSYTGDTEGDRIDNSDHSDGSDDDVVDAGAGNDTVDGGAGDDTIDGGSGSDTATWDGDFADFAVRYDSGSDTFTITDLNATGGDEGSDTVTNVETFVFNGVSYSHADMVAEAAAQADATPTDMEFDGSNSLTSESATATFSGQSHQYDLEGDAADSTGGNDGTVHGATTIAGNDGNALSFDETDDYVTVPDVTMTDSFTVTFQFMLDDNTGSLFQYMYSHGSVNDSNSLNIFINEASHGTDPNMLRTVIRDDNDTLDNTALEFDISSVVGDGEWHTYTLTVEDGVGSNVYLDGVLQNTDTRGGDGFNPSGDVVLGGREDLNADRFFGGALDTVQIYDRPLTSSEITELSGSGSEYVAAGTVVARVTQVATAGTPGTNTFSLVDDAGGVFQINPTTGDVTLVADLDLDTAFTDTVTVRVTNEHGSSYDETVEIILGAGSADDVIVGSGEQSIIYGLGGNDTIEGGAGDDTVFAGDGDDTFDDAHSDNGADHIDMGAGNDTAWGGDGADTIIGGDGSDDLYGEDGDDLITGGQGSDYIDGDAGDDTLSGGDDNDTIYGGEGTDSIAGDAGNDVLSGNAGDDTIDGGTGNDGIWGGDDNDSLSGDDGDDTLHGGSGDDSLTGGQGADSLGGGDGDDTVDGGAGSDTLAGGAGSDLMYGGSDADTFVIEDGFGNDTIAGGESVTTGTDVDTIDLSAVTVPLTVTFTGDGAGTITDGTDTITFSDIERLVLNEGADVVDATSDSGGIEIVAAGGDDTFHGSSGGDSVEGGAGDDYLDGNEGDDTLVGGDGADTLHANSGDDSLSGGEGDDSLYAGSGNDTIDGGAGDDHLDVDDDDGTVTVIGGSGQDTLDVDPVATNDGFNITYTSDGAGTFSAVSGTASGTFTGIEAVEGTGNDDTIDASADTDSDITSHGGDDVIHVGGGTTTVDAGSGDDHIRYTVAGSHTVDGGDGYDIIDLSGVTTGGINLSSFSGIEEIRGSDHASGDNWHWVGGDVTYVGGLGGDTVSAGSGSDSLIGGSGDDSFAGGAGADSISGGAGDDTIDGGAGSDTAEWSGDFSDFAIVYDSGTDTFTITDQNASGGDEGTDSVTGIETFVFNGVSYSHADLMSEAAAQNNEAPTSMSFAGNSDLEDQATPAETVVTGQIRESAGYSTVDRWELTHAGGDLTIDVLADGYNGGSLDSQMLLYRDNGDGSFTLVASNDDGAGGDDGSTSSYDSYLSESGLAAGTYVLALSGYPLGDSEALNTSSNYANETENSGPYQITFTGDSSISYAENPDNGGSWGDPFGDATIVSTTPGSPGLESGDVVLQVTDVEDADAGDTHTFTLSDDAGGDFTIDANSGEIALTGDPRGGGVYQDSITVVATDSEGETHTETIGVTLGTSDGDALSGTAGNDVVYGFDGADTLTGGAGDDTLIGGADGGATGWITVSDNANLQGTSGSDFFSWDPSANASTLIRFNYSAPAGEGDGVADYVLMESTENTGWLTIGDFDVGTDKIVLQENYTAIEFTNDAGMAEIIVTYANGNRQGFRVYHAGGGISMGDIFTTDAPETPSSDDIALYAGDAADFDVSYNAVTATFTVTDIDTADGLDEGTDLVSGIETFSFNGVEVDATDFIIESSIAGGSYNFDSGYSATDPTPTAEGTSGDNTISATAGSDQVVYARAGDDTITTGTGDDAIYAGSGDDTVTAGAGDDTIYGGTGNDSMSGGDGNDTFVLTAMEGADTIDGGSGWTDVIDMMGFSGDITVTGTTIDGEGWTVLLDDGHSVTGQTLDSIELSTDATGVISFDEGGTIDFTGIDRIGF